VSTDHLSLSFRSIREIKRITSTNWSAFAKDILEIEQRSFPTSIRDSEQSLHQLVNSPSSIFLAGLTNTTPRVAGYIAGDSLDKFRNLPGVRTDVHLEDKSTIYISSLAVYPLWRNYGLATSLLKEFLMQASENGMVRATAHMRRGRAKKFGVHAEVISSFPNWFGTGHTFEYSEFSVLQRRRK
jgi:ribosomal protein S18 acetylase RimI-like enzyme